MRAPVERSKATWSCAEFFGAASNAGGRSPASPDCSMRNDPDMPRCMTSSSAPSRSAIRYFARRRSASTRRPVSRSTKRSGNGNRKSGRRCSIAISRAPSMAGASPLRTVSTSGSSGTRGKSSRRRPIAPALPFRSNEIQASAGWIARLCAMAHMKSNVRGILKGRDLSNPRAWLQRPVTNSGPYSSAGLTGPRSPHPYLSRRHLCSHGVMD